jgi:translation initiation factor 4A
MAAAATTAEADMAGGDYNVSESITVYKSFDDMFMDGGNLEILRGIASKGWESPSPIQSRVIKPMMDGRGIIAQSRSGTGKTGAFSIGALSHVDPTKKDTQVLILSHTRELANQITKEVSGLAHYMGKSVGASVNVHCATGGVDIKVNQSALRSGAQVLVGTPGRIKDLAERRDFNPSTVKILILDELDNLLKDEFRMQIVQILKLGFRNELQICMFSATCTAEILDYAKNNLIENPLVVLVNKEKLTLDGISQYYVDELESDRHKEECLVDLIKGIEGAGTQIIFVNDHRKAERVTDYLRSKEFSVGMISGHLEQPVRNQIINDFRNTKFKILVSTDLCARGIDVQNVGLVFNFELPTERENYLHRIGRSGRYGRKGVAINLINTHEKGWIHDIEEAYHTSITPLSQDLAIISNKLNGTN